MLSKEAENFVEATLTGNFSRLAKVNVMTGEYTFIKGGEGINSPNIFEYVKSTVDTENNNPDDIREYLRFVEPKFVRERVFSGEKRLTRFFRPDRSHGLMVFCGIVPEDCSPEKPWVVFGWRKADMYTTLMADSLNVLSSIYYKILKINLTKDSFNIIKMQDEERAAFSPEITKISQWWTVFAESGNVHPEEMDIYKEFTDIDRLKEHFRADPTKESCRYRRKIGNEFMWVQMDIEPGVDYTEENQILLLYVKDIHKEYMAEMDRYTKLVDTYNRDPLTMLYNRHKFNTDIETLTKNKEPHILCIYIDVNGLHELNNSLGHKKGDDMLCTVADCLRKYFVGNRVYRIGGDEYIVLSEVMHEDIALQKLELVRRELAKDNYAISAGVAYGSADMTLQKIVGAAELAMREDKDNYYKTYDIVQKKRTMNEELEKILAQKRDEEYFINAISEKFPGVYVVDLKTDSTRSIFIPGYFLGLLEDAEHSFSRAILKYADMYAIKDDSNKIKELLDYKVLEERLRKGDVNVYYKKVNGESMKLNISLPSVPRENVLDTVWIFSKE